MVQLINKIREEVDGQQQRPRTDKADGTVRFFILGSNVAVKRDAEARIADRMKQITGGQEWTSTPAGYTTLTLEHHMAARRAGFFQLFEALQQDDSLRTGLLDGSLPSLRFFTHDVLPLVETFRANDAFAVAALVRQRSPLLSAAALKAAGDEQEEKLAEVQTSVESLASLWSDSIASQTFFEVLQVVSEFSLFEIPELLANILQRMYAAGPDIATNAEVEAADPQNATSVALQNFLMVPFEEIGPYADYVSGLASSATHQGVKGLEFPRVMVVIDDEEARGFLFSYEKLFGAKAKSDTDAKNEAEGKETTVDRTRRRFYVTCSRAEQSLAVAAYS